MKPAALHVRLTRAAWSTGPSSVAFLYTGFSIDEEFEDRNSYATRETQAVYNTVTVLDEQVLM